MLLNYSAAHQWHVIHVRYLKFPFFLLNWATLEFGFQLVPFPIYLFLLCLHGSFNFRISNVLGVFGISFLQMLGIARS